MIVLNSKATKIIFVGLLCLGPLILKAQNGNQTIPWVEDFSDFQLGLDTTKWIPNDDVYINDHMAIGAPSIGVVTFDGRNGDGDIYQLNNSSQLTPYDVLTSKPIDLSDFRGLEVSLTYFYQFGGNGFLVTGGSVTDRFFFECLNDQGEWIELSAIVKSSPSNFDVFDFESFVLGDQFLHAGFQMRFWNTSNRMFGFRNVWNLDYITIEQGPASEISLDISFSERPSHPLKVYQSLPFDQFYDRPNDYLNDSFDFSLFNHFHFREKALNDNFKIVNLKSGETLVDGLRFLRQFPDVIQDQGLLESGLTTYRNPSPKDTIRSILLDLATQNSYQLALEYSYTQDEEQVIGQQEYLDNNSTSVLLNFQDYFAYDDGTAEEIRSVLDTDFGNSSAFVIEFNITEEDDLIGFEYLLPIPASRANRDRPVDVLVWIDTLTDQPDLRIPNVILKHSNANDPQFIRRTFAELGAQDVSIPEGKFYIGFQIIENESSFEITLGVDKSINNWDKIFRRRIFDSDPWRRLSPDFIGTYMLRPVMATNTSNTTSVFPTREMKELQLFPNPVSDQIFIKNIDSDYKTISIFSISGKLIWKGVLTHQIDVSFLSNGLYIFAVENNIGQTVASTKVIIQK